MPLPKRVQRELEAANAIQAHIEAQSATVQAPQPVEVPVEVVTPEPAPAQDAEPVAPPAAPEPTPQPAAEDWHAKYRTLQGIHNANVADLKKRAAELQEQRDRAQAEVARLQEAAKAAPPAADPKYGEVFGDDLVEMVKGVATAMLAPLAEKYESRLGAIESALAGTEAAVTRTAEDLFFDRIAELVPDWESLNASEGFLSWLAEIDPIYAVPRQNALDVAQQNRDAERAARIFAAYKATLRPVEPQGKPRPTPTQQLEKLVSPRSTGGPVPAQPAPRTIPMEEVEAFYNDIARGRYRGREAAAAEQEAVYNLALSEGRITQ